MKVVILAPYPGYAPDLRATLTGRQATTLPGPHLHGRYAPVRVDGTTYYAARTTRHI